MSQTHIQKTFTHTSTECIPDKPLESFLESFMAVDTNPFAITELVKVYWCKTCKTHKIDWDWKDDD